MHTFEIRFYHGLGLAHKQAAHSPKSNHPRYTNPGRYAAREWHALSIAARFMSQDAARLPLRGCTRTTGPITRHVYRTENLL